MKKEIIKVVKLESKILDEIIDTICVNGVVEIEDIGVIRVTKTKGHKVKVPYVENKYTKIKPYYLIRLKISGYLQDTLDGFKKLL